MFDRVIAGYDGYDGGRDAIALAMALEPQQLTVLMAYGPQTVVAPTAAINYWEQRHDEAKRRVATACLELGAVADERVVSDPRPAHALHDEASEHNADLIVIGSAHRGAIGRLLVGDVGSAVLQDSPCPVAIAPKRLRDADWAPRRVGVAYDGSDEAVAALGTAQRLVAEREGMLVVFTAFEVPVYDAAAYQPDIANLMAEAEEHAQRLLDGALASLPPGAEGRLLRGRPSHALADATATVDLLLVGSRGWGTAGRLILGSTSHHLARHAACPLIVLPRPAATAQAPGEQRATTATSPA